MISAELANIDYDIFVANILPWFTKELDVVIENGDLKIEDTTEQEIFFNLENYHNFYEIPRRGIGIKRFINSSMDKVILSKAIKEELLKDGLSVESVNLYSYNDLPENMKNESGTREYFEKNKLIININAVR